MSERENSSHYNALPDGAGEALNGLLADRPLVEREGLPRGYRMRADSHYVDHLDAAPLVPPLRLISTRQLSGATENVAALTRLVESIATHGVLQPLIVRRQNGHYQVIAGNKRLAAAIAAGVTDVPCLTYDVDDAVAAALAEADNLRAPTVTENDRWARDLNYADVLRTVSQDLRAVEASASALTRAHGAALPLRVTTDLIQSQTLRAAWLADAAAIIAQQHGGSRAVSIEVILDRVKSRFEPYARLTGLYLDCGAGRVGSTVTIEQDLGTTALTGCVFATLAWLDDRPDPRIEVRGDSPNPRTLKVEIVQRVAPLDEDAARIVREPGVPRTGNLSVRLALLAARAVAALYGGTLEVAPIATGGTVIRLTFCKSAEN